MFFYVERLTVCSTITLLYENKEKKPIIVNTNKLQVSLKKKNKEVTSSSEGSRKKFNGKKT